MENNCVKTLTNRFSARGRSFSRLIFFAFILYTLYASIVSSSQLGVFSGYIFGEVHSISPAFQAAKNKELFIRPAYNYGSTMSRPHSLSGLLDSFYIRIIANITDREVITEDPYFIDPVLQFYLILKRGIFSILLILVTYHTLNKFIKRPMLVILILLMLYCSETFTGPFQVKEDMEAGTAAMLMFSLFCYYVFSKTSPGIKTGIVAAILAPIKMPSTAMSPILLYNRKAIIAFSITLFLLLFGTLRSSWDLSVPIYTAIYVSTYQWGPEFESIYQKLTYILRSLSNYYYLTLPIVLFGMGVVTRKLKKEHIFSGVILCIYIMSYFKANNVMTRFFFGLAGVYHIFLLIGLNQIICWVIKRFKETYLNVLLSILILISCVCLAFVVPKMKYVNTRDFGEIANGLSKYFVYGKYELLYAAKYDNIIKSITSYNRIYIDKRLRLNVHIDPMKDYIENGKLVVVDVLNQSESLEKNCLLLIPLFDESIIEQIGLSKYISIEKYRNYVSDSRIMNMERLISYTRRTPFFILRKSYYPIHLYEDWNSSVLKLENNDNNKAVIPISLFYIEEGKFIQEWESNISNVDFDEKREFVMYKDIIFDKGEYLLSIDMKSNYRDPKSHLRIYVNDSLVNRIYLDTTKEMMQSNRAHHLLSKLPGFRKWRNNFFEIDNSSKIKINRKGKKRVKIEIISGSNRGHVRLKDLAIYDRGINQAAYDKTFS